MAKTMTKQITLHFAGDYAQILDVFKRRAKFNFRTTEQEILFELNGIVDIIRDCESSKVPAPATPTGDDLKKIFDDAYAEDESDGRKQPSEQSEESDK